jgi:tetrahydromethanopterin S-methyltransferase subunit E
MLTFRKVWFSYPGGGTYTSGDNVTVTASPASGYEFDHWSGDISGTAASVTVTMNSDKSIIAHFRTSGGGGGGISPWMWIVVGVIIVVIVISAALATILRRRAHVLAR